MALETGVDEPKVRFRLLPRTIRGLLIVLLVVLALPIFIVEGALHYERLGGDREAEIQANLEVARTMGSYLNSFVSDVLRQEQFIGLALIARVASNSEETAWLLASAAGQHPAVAYFAWLDPRGNVLSSSHKEVVGSNLGEQIHLDAIKPQQEYYVSDLVLSGAAPAFFIARGIHDRDLQVGGHDGDASLSGVVVAAVDPRWLGDVLKTKRSGQGDVSILDRQARPVFSYPEGRGMGLTDGSSVQSPLVAKALAGEEASGSFVPDPSLPERLAGFSPIRSTGWVAGASRPAEVVYDAAVEDYLNETGFYAVVTVLALIVATLLSRRLTGPMARLCDHAAAVGRGEIGARLHVDSPAELATLAIAFNRMAKEIEVRRSEEQAYVTEIEEAEESLRQARDELEDRVRDRTAELAASEERFRSVMETAVNAIILVDQRGKVLFWNRAATRLFGYSDGEMVGGTLAPVIPPRLWEDYRTGVSRLLTGERSVSVGGAIEVVGRRKDGSEFPAELSIGTTQTAGGPLFTSIVRDLTRRKQADENLKESVVALRRALEHTVQAMAMTVETRDPYTAGHQRRVAELAHAIAQKMELPGEQISVVRLAATIHDIGKISVPAEILVKPGKITEWEFDLIKAHPQIGHDILMNIDFPWPIARIVHEHHERMDGSGYPVGLRGDDILVEAKIVAVADVVEAMATYRPYRPALGVREALQEITQNGGVLYDPGVVAACLAVFEDGFEWEA